MSELNQLSEMDSDAREKKEIEAKQERKIYFCTGLSCVLAGAQQKCVKLPLPSAPIACLHRCHQAPVVLFRGKICSFEDLP